MPFINSWCNVECNQAVPNYIFVSRKLDLEKPTRQPGKKNEAMKKNELYNPTEKQLYY